MLWHRIEHVMNEGILQFFQGLIDRKNLHHAYCFVGPKDSHKEELASTLAANILHVSPEKLPNHADFLLLEQEVNEKTGKTKRDIDIEQIKKLREFCGTRPFLGDYKVVIIGGASKMNDHSSNALLKTLEEPKGQTVIFLLTEDEHALLPTIRSRSQQIYLTSEKKEKGKEEWVQLFLGLFGEPFYKKLQQVEYLFGDKTDSVAARENLQEVLDAWELVNRDCLFASLGQPGLLHEISLSHSYEKETFLQIQKKILEAKKYLQNNIHPRLLVEQILLQIP